MLSFPEFLVHTIIQYTSKSFPLRPTGVCVCIMADCSTYLSIIGINQMILKVFCGSEEFRPTYILYIATCMYIITIHALQAIFLHLPCDKFVTLIWTLKIFQRLQKLAKNIVWNVKKIPGTIFCVFNYTNLPFLLLKNNCAIMSKWGCMKIHFKRHFLV